MTDYVTTPQGMKLAYDAAGPIDGRAVLFFHGGGQTRHSWGKAVATLGKAGYRAMTFDLRGHGDSDWSPDASYDPAALTGDFAAILDHVGRPAALVGASMGGLTSLVTTAQEPPGRVAALVLVDIVPRIEAAGTDAIGAFMTANPDGFASVDEAADAVAAYLPHRPRRSDSRGLLKNLRQRANGRFYWHWDPAMISGKRVFDRDAVEAMLQEAARKVRVPTMLVRGGLSKVVSDEGVADLLRLIPQAEVVNIAGADHMVAGDANDRFAAPLLGFLERAMPSG
jgi:pimeloyl-ACP methyl ester carboxylesterase